jgi:proteasome-associated ATPase
MPGIVLYGPPGNGKTLLGKAAATSIQEIYGRSDGPSPFMYVKGAELLSRYVGNTESAIRSIFARARKFYKKFGMPMVVFFDEAEALFRRRGSGISSDISDTIVPAMLAEMQGFGETGAFVMLATNRVELMDPAIIRDGRVGGIVEVKAPTPEVAFDIFRIHLDDKPPSSETDVDELAQLGVDELFNPERLVGHRHTEPLAARVSGAMIEGVVDRAVSIALHRDIEGRRRKTGSGICTNDMFEAVNQVHSQQMALA